jgi:SAM-dependent methyltransferase
MSNEFLHKLQSTVPARLIRSGIRRLIPHRLRCYVNEREAFVEKTGLEFGGPSLIFAQRGIFPVYQLAARIDNCNFDYQTLWEGKITPQSGFRFNAARAPGKQFVAEATDVGFIPDGTYDFVLSSHMLEHSANPLKAMREWLRVLKPGGTLFIVLPHRDGTFDHRRPITPLRHLMEDFERQMSEDDLTHLPEILELHDLRRDPEAGGFEAFKARSERNRENRGLHHHVFDTRLAVELLDHLCLKIRSVETAHPFHIAILATRLAADQRPDNMPFLSGSAAYRRASPFRSDRVTRHDS